MKLQFRQIAVKAIEPSPDNPRVFDPKDPRFKKLTESIDAQGVIVPVHVRRHPQAVIDSQGGPAYELLAGRRRYESALSLKHDEIPAIDHGVISAAEAFEITFAENFLRQDLKPIEAGRAVSILLAKHDDDVKAVAARMGQSPHWVATHAQIDRGLSDDWKKAAVSHPRFVPWSTAHWIEIARLAPPMQAKLLKHCEGRNNYNANHWTVDELKRHLTAERRLLAKAPFMTNICGECSKRTGFNAFLWSAAAEQVTGDKDKCLDPTCWDHQAKKAALAEFKTKVEAKGVPEAVPLDLSTAYEAKQQAKKIHGKALLTGQKVTLCKKGDEGAVAAIVVAGRGKGSVKWIKHEKPVDASSGTVVRDARAAQRQDKEVQEQQRWEQVEDEVVRLVLDAETPPLEEVAILYTLFTVDNLYDDRWVDRFRGSLSRRRERGDFTAWVAEQIWADVKEWLVCGHCPFDREELQGLADLVGIVFDVQGVYDELLARDKAAEKEAKEKGGKGQKANSKLTTQN